MRAYALLLGICLLPASAWSQQPYPEFNRRTPGMTVPVPVRALPTTACVARNAVGLGCASRGYSYDRYLDAYERRIADPPDRRVYGSGSYRRAYGDPYLPVCPAVQGGVAVVSPRNPRVTPNRTASRPYGHSSYALVAGSLPIGCSR